MSGLIRTNHFVFVRSLAARKRYIENIISKGMNYRNDKATLRQFKSALQMSSVVELDFLEQAKWKGRCRAT
jgi:hypothetical protein